MEWLPVTRKHVLTDGVVWSDVVTGKPLVQVKTLLNVGRINRTDCQDPSLVAAEISASPDSRCNAWEIPSHERIPITPLPLAHAVQADLAALGPAAHMFRAVLATAPKVVSCGQIKCAVLEADTAKGEGRMFLPDKDTDLVMGYPKPLCGPHASKAQPPQGHQR
jgi:hypothetical protein